MDNKPEVIGVIIGWLLSLAVVLGIWGVIIWAIIRLVLHFT